MFPNAIGNWKLDVDGSFDCNYFAPTYSGPNDKLGTTSNYSDGAYRISDSFDIGNIIYYSDYAMTTAADRREHYNNTNRDFITYAGLLDVTGVSFADDADTVSIDNHNNRITCLYTCGKTIQNPSLSL